MIEQENGEKTYLRLTIQDIKDELIRLTTQFIQLKTDMAKLCAYDFVGIEERLRKVEQKVTEISTASGFWWGLLGGILSGIISAFILKKVF